MSAQGIKSQIQQTYLTGDRRGDVLPEARRAPPWQGHRNAALAMFPRPCGRTHARALGQGFPLAPFPLVPINTPQGASVGRYLENRVVFVILLLGIVVVVSFFF